MPTASHDPSAYTLYVRIRPLEEGETVYHTQEESPGETIDYDRNGNVIGYEFLLDAPLEYGSAQV